jgi:hypothetical protein
VQNLAETSVVAGRTVMLPRAQFQPVNLFADADESP